MDKEKFVTIVIGLIVGVVIASGYFLAVKFLPKLARPNAPKISFNSPSQSTSPTKKNLIITAPDDNSVATASSIIVSGQAPAGGSILIFANADEKIASADAAGNFTAPIKLEDGENEISFTLLSISGPEESIKRSVILEVKP